MGEISDSEIMYTNVLVQCLAYSNSAINGSYYVVQPYHYTDEETEPQSN